MKGKAVVWWSRLAILVLVFLIVLLVFWLMLYLKSYSRSPLNVWNDMGLKERFSRLGSAGWEEMRNELVGELRYKFCRWIPVVNQDKAGLVSKAQGDGFYILRKGQWMPLYIEGVNLGCALPGHWFTQFPRDERVYLDWLEKIGAMHANSVRVYTLLPPEFYRALLYYNIKHPASPLWLFQEIWPEEYPKDENYLDANYSKEYFKEMRYVVDAVHGRISIPPRKGRAYGKYDSDVSRYLMAYLVGRELEPDEVISTNEKNRGFKYTGRYLYAGEQASPTEAWLAMSCDYVVQYEEKKYGTQHAVGIVSWPTLDPLSHDAEWNEKGNKSLEYNDKVSVDINNIMITPELQAGFFGAYHIYPNYPDFMNNEETYDFYRDDQGRLRYGGYLKEFKKVHTRYPALVGEFGLATGMGNAHHSPDGYHHGGLSEEEQGRGIVRMMKAIEREGYAGGLIFEWIDEWAKKTWITEPFMIPYERHVLWHNVIDPEQNYGLYAMESVKPKNKTYTRKQSGIIKEIAVSHDSSFLYLDIVLARGWDFEKDWLMIGIDTYDRKRGEFRLMPDMDIEASSGLEFLLDVRGPQKAEILVNPSYNISKGRFSSTLSREGRFEEIKMLTNKERVTKSGRKIPAVYWNASLLRYGDFTDNTHNHWYFKGDTLHLRLPWGLINFTDPSSLKVLDDRGSFTVVARDQLKTTKTDGIVCYTFLFDRDNKRLKDSFKTAPYVWPGWEEASYTARLKKSYYLIKEYFSALS